ncbi:MAG: hypothetical protein ACQESR_22215 [Planctomycetota bacterium]
MIQRSANKFLLGTAVSVCAVTAIVVLSAHLSAQEQVTLEPSEAGSDKPEAEPAVEIGTYKPEQVFQSHPAQEELSRASETARTQLQQAQEADDQETMERIQQEYQETQNEIVETFRKDVDEALPQAAEAAGVPVVATEIVYTAEDVGTKDITPDLINVIAENAGGEGEPPAVPQFQPQGG